MLETLNLYNVSCKLYLNKTEKYKKSEVAGLGFEHRQLGSES